MHQISLDHYPYFTIRQNSEFSLPMTESYVFYVNPPATRSNTCKKIEAVAPTSNKSPRPTSMEEPSTKKPHVEESSTNSPTNMDIPETAIHTSTLKSHKNFFTSPQTMKVITENLQTNEILQPTSINQNHKPENHHTSSNEP
ncbi:unnamed protein product [Macrosiphum euphorbiae]|uniref:Uncharacterized protein n=1 Tax=Macrosiphum euphorbiae TaxID=13131 RepID=A0AAV0W4F1_9HEMI|nr:unnamed protein product [Macrosiphum euphorbiae]